MEHIIESTKTTEFFFRGKNGTLEMTSRREHHFNHAAKRYHGIFCEYSSQHLASAGCFTQICV